MGADDSPILYIRCVGCFDIGLRPVGARLAGRVWCCFTDKGGLRSSRQSHMEREYRRDTLQRLPQ